MALPTSCPERCLSRFLVLCERLDNLVHNRLRHIKKPRRIRDIVRMFVAHSMTSGMDAHRPGITHRHIDVCVCVCVCVCVGVCVCVYSSGEMCYLDSTVGSELVKWVCLVHNNAAGRTRVVFGKVLHDAALAERVKALHDRRCVDKVPAVVVVVVVVVTVHI